MDVVKDNEYRDLAEGMPKGSQRKYMSDTVGECVRNRGVKWDLFVEYTLEALAASLVAALGWGGRRVLKWLRSRYRKRQRQRRRAEGPMPPDA